MHKKQIQKVLRVCRAMQIKVLSDKSIPEDGLSDYSSRTIELDKDLPPDVHLVTLLHELGHFVYDSCSPKLKLTVLDSIYIKERSTLAEKLIRLKCERAAWKNAKMLAKFIGVELPASFNEIKKAALKTHE